MPQNNQVRFNSEEIIFLTTISSAAENWGPKFISADDAVRAYVDEASFNKLDRGSLLRIAREAERSVHEQRETRRAVERLNKNMAKLVGIFEKLKKWTEREGQ